MKGNDFIILAADEITDGVGDHSGTETLLAIAQKAGLRVKSLRIASLREPWNITDSNLFRSGASAIEAIAHGKALLDSNLTDLICIHGHDNLRSGYEKLERSKLMKIFDQDYSPIMAYNDLTELFLGSNNISFEDYLSIRDALFENYGRTRMRVYGQVSLPESIWFESQSQYLRGVDCANPVIDYSGRIILSRKETYEALGLKQQILTTIVGSSYIALEKTGYAALTEIVKFEHLKQAIQSAALESKINFLEVFKKGEAELDAYTCYPVIPIALLLGLGISPNAKSIIEFLKHYEITLSGGLNLNRAPWSLTSLRSIIEAKKKIQSGAGKLVMVHGNGSLGEYQGILIIKGSC